MKERISMLTEEAVRLFKEKKDDEALEKINEAIALEEDSDLYYQKAVILYELDRYNESQEAIQEAVKINPKNIDAYFLNGVIAHDLEDYETAKNIFEEVVEKDTRHNMALGYLGELYLNVEDDPQKAIEIFNRVLEIDKEAIDIYFNKGIAYLNIGDKEKAMENFNRVLQFNPEDEEVLAILETLNGDNTL